MFWHSMASDFYYSRLSANEKKIWDRLDKACMDVLLSDDDADALIYVDVRDLGVKNDKADFLTLLFIYSNPQYFFLNECGATPDGNGNAVWASVGMYPDFERGSVRTNAREGFRATVRYYLEQASAKTLPEEKEKVINDLMCDKITYGNLNSIAYSQSAYSAVNGVTVCADVTSNDTRTVGGSRDMTCYNTNTIPRATTKVDSELKGYLPARLYDGLEETTADGYVPRYFEQNGITYYIVNDLNNSTGRQALIVSGDTASVKAVVYNNKTYSVVNATGALGDTKEDDELPVDTQTEPVPVEISYSWKKISNKWYYVGSNGTRAKGL